MNGPLGGQLDIDHGRGLIGHGVNAVIGRALGQIVMNLADFRIEESRMGTYGYTVSWALAENEEFCRQMYTQSLQRRRRAWFVSCSAAKP